MQWTPRDILGRVSALFDTVGQFTGIAAVAAIGLLNTWLAPAQVLMICGVSLILTLAVTMRRVRYEQMKMQTWGNVSQ